MNSLCYEALYWRGLGISTIPVYWKSKRPAIHWLEYADTLPTREQIARWFPTPLHNLAVLAGQENLVILDFDDTAVFSVFRDWAYKSSNAAQKLLKTSRIVQSARGCHIYIRSREKAVNMRLPGIDILAHHKYVIAPPSIHPSGAQYEFVQRADPYEIERIEDVLPGAWLESAVRESEHPTTPPSTERVDYLAMAGQERGKNASQTLIAEIKSRYRIEDFFPDREASSNDGRWMIARCPFHDDRSPSMSIDVQNQVCSCLAGCTPKPLDVIGFYARMHDLSNWEAIEALRR